MSAILELKKKSHPYSQFPFHVLLFFLGLPFLSRLTPTTPPKKTLSREPVAPHCQTKCPSPAPSYPTRIPVFSTADQLLPFPGNPCFTCSLRHFLSFSSCHLGCSCLVFLMSFCSPLTSKLWESPRAQSLIFLFI